MSREEIIKLLEIVTNAYPYAKISDAGSMVSAWEMTLGEFSAESVYKATRLHMETNKFFPTPADIRDLIVRASIVYREEPTTPAIEAPKGRQTICVEGQVYDKKEYEKWKEDCMLAMVNNEFFNMDEPMPEKPNPIVSGFLNFEL